MTESGETFLRLEDLSRSFAGSPAVESLTLEVREHEVVTLLGPSGCGKTTTLRMVAGFETPDAGRVLLQGRDLTDRPPQRRGFGMVFQHYALFPHLDVGSNVAFGLESSDLSGTEIQERVRRVLDLVNLPGTEDRSISSLSGGQQQRVALARALAPEPRVLLLDEPLSNLDAALRERTRRELRALVKEIGITTLYVTHDQEEAFDLSDRIGVMEAGRLLQVGPAEDLYHRPATRFVAAFLGRVGVIEGVVTSAAETVACRLAESAVWHALPPPDIRFAPGDRVQLLCRPEALAFVAPGSEGSVAGRVNDRRFAGSFSIYRVSVQGGALEVQTDGSAARHGDTVAVAPKRPPHGLHVYPVPSDAQS